MSENTPIDVKTIDYKYVDIIINNNTTNLMPASYIKFFEKPIIYNQQNYKCCVSRFRIPTMSIPIFIFQDNTYLLAFSLGANDNNILIHDQFPVDDDNDDIYIIYEQLANNSNISPSNRYIYYYNQFLTDINNRLARLWTQAISNNYPNYQDQIPESLRLY